MKIYYFLIISALYFKTLLLIIDCENNLVYEDSIMGSEKYKYLFITSIYEGNYNRNDNTTKNAILMIEYLLKCKENVDIIVYTESDEFKRDFGNLNIKIMKYPLKNKFGVPVFISMMKEVKMKFDATWYIYYNSDLIFNSSIFDVLVYLYKSFENSSIYASLKRSNILVKTKPSFTNFYEMWNYLTTKKARLYNGYDLFIFNDNLMSQIVKNVVFVYDYVIGRNGIDFYLLDSFRNNTDVVTVDITRQCISIIYVDVTYHLSKDLNFGDSTNRTFEQKEDKFYNFILQYNSTKNMNFIYPLAFEYCLSKIFMVN